jgi:general L-amino acid transport system permease protein
VKSDTNAWAIMVGLTNTLIVAVLGIILATFLGFTIGVARLSSNWLVAKLATIYVETIRNIPLLLQLLFWYKAVIVALPSAKQAFTFPGGIYLSQRGLTLPNPVFGPGSSLIFIALAVAIAASIFFAKWATKRQEATGQRAPVFLTSLGLIVGLPLVAFFAAGMPITMELATQTKFDLKGGFPLGPEIFALLLGLSIYTASFIAEIVRGGINAVSHGQTEASHALGLNTGKTLNLVVIPQAMRVIIPPLTNQYLNLVKNSSLAIATAFADLVSVAQGSVLVISGHEFECVAITMGFYLLVSLLIAAFMNWFNKRVALVER